MLKRYLSYLIAFALLIAVMAIVVLYSQLKSVGGALSDEIREHAQTSAERDNARALASQREQQLITLKAHIAANTKIETQLRADLATVQIQFLNRSHLIEKLKNENAQLRQWADEPLPADVVCLRQRPALSGADAYRAWLSASRCLSAAGDRTTQQRPITP